MRQDPRVDQVMRETGMGAVQAQRHVRDRDTLQRRGRRPFPFTDRPEGRS